MLSLSLSLYLPLYFRTCDLPAVTVRRFWIHHVETCVDVITPNVWAQLCRTVGGRYSLFHSLFISLSIFVLSGASFNKHFQQDSTATLRKAANHSKSEAANISTPVPVPVPVPSLRSFVRLHLRSRSRSVPVPFTVLIPVPAPAPVPVSFPAPDSDSVLDPVRPFQSLESGYSLGAMPVYRHQALRTELSGARKRHPLSAEMMSHAERKCLLASTTLVGFLALLRLFSTLPNSVLVPLPVPILVPVHISVLTLVCLCVCVCVCVCVFIKLHITTQSGPVILVILCHSH